MYNSRLIVDIMANSFIVTGGAGFIGSYVCRVLVNSGYRVLVIDNLSTGIKSNLWGLFNNPNFKFIEGEASDERLILSIIGDYDCIIHLAATVGVDQVIQEPAYTIINNIKCTENILKAAFKFKKRVFIASSSEVYGKQEKQQLSEDDNIELYSPHIYRWSYACSKATDEFLAMGYAKKGLSVVIGRFFNVIGAKQISCFGMVLPKFVQQCLHNLPITIYGDGRQSRCFCNAADTTDAIIMLIQSSITGRVFNIGSNILINIYNLALLIRDKCNSNSIIEYIDNKSQPADYEDIAWRIPDITRIKSEIGWQPKISLIQSIEEVINYEKSRDEISEQIV